jgi:hypothetical protein
MSEASLVQLSQGDIAMARRRCDVLGMKLRRNRSVGASNAAAPSRSPSASQSREPRPLRVPCRTTTRWPRVRSVPLLLPRHRRRQADRPGGRRPVGIGSCYRTSPPPRNAAFAYPSVAFVNITSRPRRGAGDGGHRPGRRRPLRGALNALITERLVPADSSIRHGLAEFTG